MICKSIFVDDLAPGEAVDLSSHSRTVYSWAPPGSCAVVCLADRTDMVNEVNEADNYAILRDHSIEPAPAPGTITIDSVPDESARN